MFCLFLGWLPAAAAQTPPALSLPIACTPGTDCFIQQYVDVDPGPGARDFRCGGATYPEHKGTDFRVLSLKAAKAGVAVLASAGGRVKAVRDGVEDRLVATAQDAAAVKDRECGNGVVIDHGGGWETQYCHLRRGSVAVRQGATVASGAPLGLVGYSGDAQFAHVHLAVRQDGAVIDPFLGDAIRGACLSDGAPTTAGLWAPSALAQLSYTDAAIIQTGFAAAPVSPAAAEAGDIAPPVPVSPALLFFARSINMRAGDALRLKLEGPDGFQASGDIPADRAKAHFVGFTGRKRTGERWPAGTYRGTVEVVRAGAAVSRAEATLDMP